jgi:hypothetical protein
VDHEAHAGADPLHVAGDVAQKSGQHFVARHRCHP